MKPWQQLAHLLPRSWFLNIFPHEKEPERLSEMADQEPKTGKYKERLSYLVPERAQMQIR